MTTRCRFASSGRIANTGTAIDRWLDQHLAAYEATGWTILAVQPRLINYLTECVVEVFVTLTRPQQE